MLEQFQSIQRCYADVWGNESVYGSFQEWVRDDTDGAAGAADGKDSAPESGQDGEKAGTTRFPPEAL